MSEYRVAVAGATGLVGRTILRILEERSFPVGEIRLLATERSAGQEIEFAGRKVKVQIARPEAFEGMDLAFFAVGTDASRILAPIARDRGAVAIDKSNAFRMDPAVPLVVPEVNADALAGHRGIIASPNCSTIQMVAVLKPLDTAAGLARVVVSTYQSVSGSGRGGMVELESQLQDLHSGRKAAVRFYPRQVAMNLIPHIDSFLPDGYTGEERKMILETRKILGLPELPVTATTVRVPVMVGHAEAVNVETRRKLTRAEALRALAAAPGVVVMDDPAAGLYPTPLDAAGRDEVLVGRVREDPSIENGLDLWIVADNLRKGAATNAVQIAEHLVSARLIG
ncbi:MAG: aspartate-semialdehyde dehydrogenase [Bacillota bacterium]|nr:aspartate-semialdehyde dehydrogenase [Bacillota bacterium]